jgi:hypothetical protein
VAGLPDGAWQAVQEFLQASASPREAARHYDLLSDHAMVVVGPLVGRKADIGRQLFLDGFARLAKLPRQAWGPTFAPVRLITWQPDDGGGRLWAELRERRSRRIVTAVFVCDGPDWTILAAGLDEEQETSRVHTLAKAMAEFANWAPHDRHPVWPQSGLALAFDRLYPEAPEPLLTLPEARFTCQGRGDCCRFFHLQAHRNAATALNAVDWQALGQGRPSFGPLKSGHDTDGQPPGVALTMTDGACEAYTGTGCAVHAAVGWQPIETCQLYPLQAIATPDGLAVTASFLCGTVAENHGQPLAERVDDLRQRLRPFRDRMPVIPRQFPLRPDGPPITWKAYRRLEAFLLDRLAEATTVTPAQSLSAGHVALTLLLHETTGLARVDEAHVQAALTGARPTETAMGRDLADGLLAMIMQTGVLAEMPEPLLGGRWEPALTPTGRSELDEAAAEVRRRFLRTVLFRKRGLTARGAAFLWGTVVLCAALWDLDWQHHHEQEAGLASRERAIRTARRVDTALLHSGLLQTLAAVPALALRLADPRVWFSLGAL